MEFSIHIPIAITRIDIAAINSLYILFFNRGNPWITPIAAPASIREISIFSSFHLKSQITVLPVKRFIILTYILNL